MENQAEPKKPSSGEIIVRKSAGASLSARAQYVDLPPSEVIEEPGSSLLLEYWHILCCRKGTLMVAAFLGALVALLYTLPQTPVYQAHTTIEIQALNENFLNMESVNPTMSTTYYPGLDIQTQIKILQSESLVKRVLAKFKDEEKSLLVLKTDRISAWRKALGLKQAAPPSERETSLAMVAGNLKVRAQRQTRIIEILYDSTDPQVAARFLNTLSNEFIEQNMEARWQTTERTSQFLGRQIEDFKIKLEKSEETLQSYAATSGLMFIEENNNLAEQKLRQLQEELSKAGAERVARESHYEIAVASPPGSLPDVLDDPSLRDSQTKLTDLRRQRAELGTALTPAHPRVKRVEAQIAVLETALQEGRAKIVERIRNEFETAQRRESLLAADFAAQSKLVTEQAARVTHYSILRREVDTNRQFYDTMLQKVQEAGITSAIRASNIRVVDPATPPEDPYKPRVFLNSVLGLVAGLFFGVMFAIMRERANRSIQSPGEASLYLNVPELGVIPSADAERSRRFDYYREGRSLHDKEPVSQRVKNGKSGQVELVTWQRKPSVLAESFRATLTSILYSGENGNRPRVIVLTSPNPREGKTTVANNLALALAEIGKRVLLIDGDLRKPRLHEIHHLRNQWGLSDFLLGKKPPSGREAMVMRTGYQELYLLPAGSAASSISSLLHSARMPELLIRMRQEFDMILIDTPPMLLIPDARLLGPLSDGVILVLRSMRTTRDEAAAATQRLTDDGSRVLGTVLNYWDPKNTSRDSYGYGYGYRYYH